MNISNQNATSVNIAELATSKECKAWIVLRMLVWVFASIIFVNIKNEGCLLFVSLPWAFKLFFDLNIVSRFSAGKSVNVCKYAKRVYTIKILMAVILVMVVYSKLNNTSEDEAYMEGHGSALFMMICGIPVIFYHIVMRFSIKKIINKDNTFTNAPIPFLCVAGNFVKIFFIAIAAFRSFTGLFEVFNVRFVIILIDLIVLLAEALIRYDILKKTRPQNFR